MEYAKSSIIILLTLMFSRSLGCLKTGLLAAICDDNSCYGLFTEIFSDGYVCFIHFIYFLKTIGNSDFVVGKMTLPSILFFFLISFPFYMLFLIDLMSE